MVAAVGGSGAALSAGQMESMESSGDMKYMVDHWRGQGTEQHSLCTAAEQPEQAKKGQLEACTDFRYLLRTATC